MYWKALPLRPGRYKVDIAVKDVNGDRKGLWSRGIVVPEYSDDKLATSSLIVADVMEPVPTKDVSTGNSSSGSTKFVRAWPRPMASRRFQAESRPEGELLDASL